MRDSSKIRCMALYLTIVTAILFGAGQSEDAPSSGEISTTAETQALESQETERFVIDTAGRKVVIPDQIERVIVLATPSAEVLRAIGVSDRIVGIPGTFLRKTLWSDYTDIPIVAASTSRDVDYEAIMALNPDVLITNALRGSSLEGHVETLEPAGITVLGADCTDFNMIGDEIEMIGRFFGKEKEAEELWDYLSGIVEEVSAITSGFTEEEYVRVYAEQPSDFNTKGSGASWAPILKIAGAMNVFAEFSESAFEVDTERIMEMNPAVFLKDAYSVPKLGLTVNDPSEVEAYFRERAAQPGWHLIDFVKNDRMYAISRDIGSGPTKYVSVAFFAKLLHPEHFPDLDPDAVLKEYFNRFHGKAAEGIVAWPKTW